ncbi:MAG: hypothetical protein M0O96_10160 [Desulforhopalus sp.]|nr:hypothetical protein [Desulforhopalus sp.]
MKGLGFFGFDVCLSRIDTAGDPLVKLEKTGDWKIFRSILEEVRNTLVRRMQGRKFLMLPCSSKFLSSNRFIIWQMTRWGFKYVVDFPVFWDVMRPAKCQMRQQLSISVKTLQRQARFENY